MRCHFIGMRDDRYRGTTLPRPVRRLCKMAEREADRAHPERLRDQALAAFVFDAERMSVDFHRRLRRCALSSDLFDANELAALAKTGLEAEIARNIEAGVVVGPAEAICSALRQQGKNHVRELNRQLITDRRSDTSIVSNAVQRALDEAAPLAARLILQGRRAPRIEDRVHLDEDLRAPLGSGMGL